MQRKLFSKGAYNAAMKRFICQCNIDKFEQVLRSEVDAAVRAQVVKLLAAERRQMALLDAADFGARDPSRGPPPPSGQLTPEDDADLRAAMMGSPNPVILLDPGPGLRMLEVNGATERVSGIERENLVGKPFFDVFPDSPQRPLADGVTRLSESLREAARSGRPHAMALQRYDLKDAAGVYQPHYWTPTNTPILDAGGRLTYLVHESREAPPPSVDENP